MTASRMGPAAANFPHPQLPPQDRKTVIYNNRERPLRRWPIFFILLAILAFLPTVVDPQETPSGARKAPIPAAPLPATSSKSPRVRGLPNLTLVKEKLTAYHDCTCDCGCYTDDLARAGNEALAFLKRYLQAHKKQKDAPAKEPAIVLDVDETALSTWAYVKQHDFSYSRDWFVKWEEENRLPAIAPILTLFRFAQENRIAIFFVTGRPESDRDMTVKDLESAGYKGWTGLIMRKADSPKLAADFKSAERKKLREAGYALVLNVGDQESDLAGEPALKSFKLPNPFYYVR